MHWRAYGKYNGKGTVFAMKIINKHNFWGVVCTIYAMLSLGKILLEAVFQNVFGNDQKNLLTMFFLSLAATFVLSQYYRFQKYPLLLCIAVQYMLLIACVMLITWISGRFEPLHEDAYRDMFLSFTIPYAIGVVVYYMSVFYEIKRANQDLKKIKENNGHDEK